MLTNILNAAATHLRWVGAARTSTSAVAYSLLSRVFVLTINLATGIIVARALGPEGRGAAAAISLWPVVISGLLTAGVPAALRFEVRRRVDRPTVLFSSALLISVVLGLLALVAGLFVVPLLLVKYPRSVVAFAQLMMLFAPLILVNSTLQAFYESQGDFRRSNAMMFVPPALTLVGLLILHTMHRISPYSVALLYEAPFALTTFATILQVRRFIRLPRNIAERIRSLLHYGVRAYGIDILNVLAAQIDQAMVIGLLSAGSFGLYVVAVNGSRMVSLLGMSLNTVLFPKASGLDGAGAVALVGRSARISFAITSLAGIGLVIALPVVVPIAYGGEYASIVGITRLLTFAVVIGATTSTFNQVFLATGRPEIATGLQFAGLCITVPLMYTLIPKFGLTGAAYSVDISSALRFALVMISYPIFLRHKIPRLLLTRQDILELFSRLRRVSA